MRTVLFIDDITVNTTHFPPAPTGFGRCVNNTLTPTRTYTQDRLLETLR